MAHLPLKVPSLECTDLGALTEDTHGSRKLFTAEGLNGLCNSLGDQSLGSLTKASFKLLDIQADAAESWPACS